MRLGPIKLYIDGALGPRTAALKEPYADGSASTVLIYPPEEFNRRVLEAHRGGWQIGVHAIGDLAVELCIRAFEKAQEAFPRPDPRHRIEHCFLTDAAMVRDMVRLGILAVVQPEFIHHLAHYYRPALGDRTDRGMPVRTWLRAGVAVAFSSDQPVVPGDPIVGWRTAVNRKHKTGFTVAPEEGLDPITALKCFTAGSAYATFDDAVGVLAAGEKGRLRGPFPFAREDPGGGCEGGDFERFFDVRRKSGGRKILPLEREGLGEILEGYVWLIMDSSVIRDDLVNVTPPCSWPEGRFSEFPSAPEQSQGCGGQGIFSCPNAASGKRSGAVQPTK